jgi:RimJ/RimL family protein N-acetyltransferase
MAFESKHRVFILRVPRVEDLRSDVRDEWRMPKTAKYHRRRRRAARSCDVARADDDDRAPGRAQVFSRCFSVFEKATGRWFGRLGPWMPEGWPGPGKLAGTIVRDCWGRGYAPEGATAATNWAFDHLGWTHVIHSIDPANVASQVVARKLGSRNPVPDRCPAPFQDATVDIWGQTRD